jgi:hypothetical protein
MARVEPGKGIKPVENAIGYLIPQADESVVFCSIVAYNVEVNGQYRAWVYHPKFGLELMTPQQGWLEKATPIIAVSQDELTIRDELLAGLRTELNAAQTMIAELTTRLDALTKPAVKVDVK